MALPQLTPEQRAQALREGGRRAQGSRRAEGRAEVREALAAAGPASASDDTVGQDEGVGRARVAARRRQGARRKDHGGARHQRHPPRAWPRREAARAAAREVREVSVRPWLHAEAPCSSSPARPGSARGPSCASGPLAYPARARPLGERDDTAASARRGRRRRLLLRRRGRVRSHGGRRRAAGVGRGLPRTSLRHPGGARGRFTATPAATCCSRSTSRARGGCASASPTRCTILLEPPSRDELERRLRSRGTETDAGIAERLAKADWELSQAALGSTTWS